MTNNKWIKSGLTLSAALVLAACGGAGNKSEEGSTGADDQAAETTEDIFINSCIVTILIVHGLVVVNNILIWAMVCNRNTKNVSLT